MDGARAAALDGLAQRFGRDAPGEVSLVLSPYRICPLGAHVDHQDGVVSGMAIDQGVVVAFASREDTLVRAASANFSGEQSFDLRQVPAAVPGDWGNFLRGAAVVLSQRHLLTRGVDLYVVGQLPIGGLSSSAAVAVGYLLALEAANGLVVPAEQNVSLARAIENEYVGLHSGVLDQSMILLSQQDRLLRLDCRTGEREYVAFGAAAVPPTMLPAPTSNTAGRTAANPMPSTARSPGLRPAAIGVAYSGLAQALVGTGYNQRVSECQAAASQLLDLAGRPLPANPRLRDVPTDVFEQYRQRLPALLARRAAHFFGEQRRVGDGAAAWYQGDMQRFGQLVSESGRSSIEYYECGAPELVTLYETLISLPGVYGARFSGAGFRGSCLALIDPAALADVSERVRRRYLAAHPAYAGTFAFFECASGPGARVTAA